MISSAAIKNYFESIDLLYTAIIDEKLISFFRLTDDQRLLALGRVPSGDNRENRASIALSSFENYGKQISK